MIARTSAEAGPLARTTALARAVRWALALTAAAMPLYVVRWRVGPLPTTLLEVLIVLTAALYVVAALRREVPLPRRTPYDLPIAVFVVAATIGVVVPADHRAALGIYRAYILEPLAIYYIATTVLDTEEALNTIVAALGIGVAMFAVVEVVTFMQAYLNHTLKIGIADAAFGINPNSVAIYLEPLLALAAGFALFGRGAWRLAAAALFALLVVAEVMTLSRGGLLALAVLALIAFLTLRSTVVKLAVVAAGLIGAIVVWQLPLIGMRLTYFRLDPSGSLYGREHIWTSTLKMLTDRPIFGAGVGAYQAAMAPYRAADTYQVPEPYAHNIVLTTWSEVGLLGLVAFLWILALLVIRPWRALSRAVGMYRPLVWGLGAAFAMIAVHGLVDSPYWKNDLSVEFWLLAALEVVALRAVASLRTANV